MKRKELLVWLPSIIGFVLLCISQIDLYLFKQGVFQLRTILIWEIVFVIVGLLGSIFVLIFGLVCLFDKAWLLALQSLVSPCLFIVFFGIGGAMGAAYLNAT